MSPISLSTSDGRTEFSPGERLDVTIDWQLAERPRAVAVRLVWYTRGKGDTDVCVVDEERFENPQAFQRRECTFQLPEAPFSFSGKLVSLVWAVEVVLPEEELAGHAELVMGPGGREARVDGEPEGVGQGLGGG